MQKPGQAGVAAIVAPPEANLEAPMLIILLIRFWIHLTLASNQTAHTRCAQAANLSALPLKYFNLYPEPDPQVSTLATTNKEWKEAVDTCSLVFAIIYMLFLPMYFFCLGMCVLCVG